MKILPTCIYTQPIWYNCAKYEVSYLMNFKCASTSIRRSLDLNKKSSTANFIPFTLLREPIARAVSIYNEMVNQNKHYKLSFKGWLIRLQQGFYDSHQIPQSHWLERATIEQDQDVRIFTDIKDVEEWLGVKIPHANQSRIETIPDLEDIELIKELWAEDIILYDTFNDEPE